MDWERLNIIDESLKTAVDRKVLVTYEEYVEEQKHLEMLHEAVVISCYVSK